MAKLDTKRFCPHHGDFILLADCPIVATSEIVNGQAREALSSDFAATLGIERDDLGTDPERPSERRSMPATLAPEIGSLLHSKIDNLTRKVLAAPAGRRRSPSSNGGLPPAARLAHDVAARPARACPQCCHPLPAAIDERDPYAIALAGHTEASKTTTILALMEAVEDLGPRAPSGSAASRRRKPPRNISSRSRSTRWPDSAHRSRSP